MATRSVQNYDGQGNLLSTDTVEVPDELIRADTLRERVLARIGTLETACAQWDTLTAAQRLAAQKAGLVLVTRLARLVLSQLDSDGVPD